MNTSSATHFTAAQIAAALGRQRQAVARSLADVPADGCAVICGAAVRAWSIAALPVAMQQELEQTAQRRGQRNALALLAAPAKLWKPAVPLAEASPAAVDAAAKLQRSLARVLARQDDATLSAAELEALGVADYTREFGHAVSTRHLRGLLRRTLDRDGGAQHFDRLEIYLPENAAPTRAAKPIASLASESIFHPLHSVITNFADPAAPSLAEKSYLWLSAFEAHDAEIAAGRAPKKVRRELIGFLARNAPFLVSANAGGIANAIRANFARKYDKWVSSGRDAKALTDARAANSGRWRAPEISSEDRDKLITHAVFSCGGRVAQAWRELIERQELSEAVMGYYLSNPAFKSYVPARVSEAVKYEVASMYDIHHGPRQAKLNGPHISRDWSGVHSMDWLQGDDFTFPIYFRAPDGNGGWINMRGQALLMIDLRSMRILGFVLLSQRNYNARAIRTLITKVCDEHGLARKGFYFEHGIWESSKMLTGQKNAPPLSWGEVEMGLREFGLDFKHAELPRAKLVERVGGMMQDLMEGLPGYVGRNEIVEKFERVQKAKRDAERGDPAAVAQFMDEDQWSAQLQTLCERYNAAPQNGKVCAGRSPDETFRQCQNLADPPVKFTANCRYLLAHHKRPVKVTSKGILIEKAYYYGAEIARLKGQTLLAWIDPETPEFITVTDMNRKNAVCVPRAADIPAMNASDEAMAAAHRQIAAFTNPTNARYRILKARHAVNFRPMIADRETTELGAQIGAQRAAVETAQRTEAKRETKSRNAASRLGIALPQNQLRRPETAPALERLAELLADDPTPETSNEKGRE